ncbi:MAG TPA: hypothetical protein DEV93_00145 [Chloroflexi bacterium]|nr:hypothetical protein [Chloroflexota bacterium]
MEASVKRRPHLLLDEIQGLTANRETQSGDWVTWSSLVPGTHSSSNVSAGDWPGSITVRPTHQLIGASGQMVPASGATGMSSNALPWLLTSNVSGTSGASGPAGVLIGTNIAQNLTNLQEASLRSVYAVNYLPDAAPIGEVTQPGPAREQGASWNVDLPDAYFLRVAEPREETSESGWLIPVLERIDELLSLPPGWDTHGSRSINARHARRAVDFLMQVMGTDTPPPTIIPVSNGGVQLEWHLEGIDAETLFDDENDDDLYCLFVESGEEWEGPGIEGFHQLHLAERLTGAASYAAP